jgi:hypothetical protein
MKSWLIQLKISNALNDRRPLAPAVERAITRSEEARLVAGHCSALDQTLKSQLPRPEAPASLHASIMRAVRAARYAPVAENQPRWLRWIPVSSLVLLALLGVVATVHFSRNPGARLQPADSHTLSAAVSALEAGGSLARQAPAAAISPLSDEMERLDRDLANAEQFLSASLP